MMMMMMMVVVVVMMMMMMMMMMISVILTLEKLRQEKSEFETFLNGIHVETLSQKGQ